MDTNHNPYFLKATIRIYIRQGTIKINKATDPNRTTNKYKI
jgi:hypothetical protein